MGYFIVFAILIIAGVFFLDKKDLEKEIKTQGGIKKKYKILINRIVDDMQAEFAEHKDHLIIVVKSETVQIEYVLLPSFNSVIVTVTLTSEYGNKTGKWNFNEIIQTQQEMARAIEFFIENSLNDLMKSVNSSNKKITNGEKEYKKSNEITAQERLLVKPDILEKIGASIVKTNNERQSDYSNTANISLDELIRDIAILPLAKKIELAVILYITQTTDEQKARTLSIWYQSNHENPFSDWIEMQFEKCESQLLFKPIYSETAKNYQIILKSIQNINGYEGIEEVILDGLASTKEIYEIDRILFILLSIKPEERLHNEILNLSYQNWINSNQVPLHYNFLLLKTSIDVLMVKERYEEALKTSLEIYSVLLNQASGSQLPWLKYQLTSVLISLMEKGYQSNSYSKKNLEENKIKFEEEGYLEDMIFKKMNS